MDVPNVTALASYTMLVVVHVHVCCHLECSSHQKFTLKAGGSVVCCCKYNLGSEFKGFETYMGALLWLNVPILDERAPTRLFEGASPMGSLL